ncbi:MAG: hypothetical protein SOZ77_02890 [Candidatus Limousia pullorum]|nr:hypothetical protein [Candidatus Limousia pullorum]
MNFNRDLLNEYKTLLQTTDLIEAYQEFIKLFRFLRIELEKTMTEYRFQGNIAENGMDYSYFLFWNEELKSKGLKIAVVFVHRDFRFEVWVSGFNRKYQSKYYDILKDKEIPFELTSSPTKTDYILRVPADISDISNGDYVVEKIKSISDELLIFIKHLNI